MDAVLALMNAFFLAFIVSTMFHVGLVTTIEHLIGVVRNVRWLVGALVAIVVGGFQQVIDLIGSYVMLAGLVGVGIWMVAGAVVAPGPPAQRGTAALLASSRNAGPVLLIATASFTDVQGVIPTVIAVYVIQLATQLVVAARLGKRTEAATTLAM